MKLGRMFAALFKWNPFKKRYFAQLKRPKVPVFRHRSKLPVTKESAKLVFDNRRKIILYDLLLHLPPVAITAVLVYLNIQSVYWGDAQANGTLQSTLLSGLQFAAKAHELWMGFSIATIVSHFVIVMLARHKGLPFGLLGAGIQVGDTSFFLRKSFWLSAIRPSRKRKFGIIMFATFVALCSAISAFAGPSSAIAMRPNFDWWQVTNDTLNYQFQLSADLWPMKLLVPPDNEVNCSRYDDAGSTSFCPASGLLDITTLLQTHNMDSLSGITANVTFVEAYFNTRTVVASAALSPGHTYATSPSVVPRLALGYLWGNISHESSFEFSISEPKFVSRVNTIKQPMIQVECGNYALSSLTNAATKPETQVFFPSIANVTNQSPEIDARRNMLVPEEIWNKTRTQQVIDLTWVDLYTEYNGSASIGAVFIVPITKRIVNGTDYDTIQDSLVVPCTFDARWMQSQLSFQPKDSDIITWDLPDVNTFHDLGILIADPSRDNPPERTSPFSNIINVDPQWATYLNIYTPWAFGDPTNTNARPSNDTSASNSTLIPVTLDAFLVWTPNNTVLFNPFPPDVVISPGIATDIQNFLSLYSSIFMANGLAHYGAVNVVLDGDLFGSIDILNRLKSNGKDAEAPAGWTQLYFEVWRHGYSYGVRSVTTRLALVLLLTQATLTIGFMIYLCFAGFRTSAWGSIGELVALALRSRGTDQFQNTDAGIDRPNTWAQNLRIRDVGSGRLEMRFGEDGCAEEKGERVGLVCVGKRYGDNGRSGWL